MLMIGDSESETFLTDFRGKFQVLQAQFLNLLNSELKYYESNGATKDLVNPDILKNLVEILNMQILLKLADKKQNTGMLRMKNAAPIDLRIF